jgi:hypothetical protein
LTGFKAQSFQKLLIGQRACLPINQPQGIKKAIGHLDILSSETATKGFKKRPSLAAQLTLLSEMVNCLADELPGKMTV